MARVRNPIMLSIFALCAFGVLIALGVWQVQRLRWKTGLISRLEQGIAAPPVPYVPPTGKEAEDREFKHVRSIGRFRPEDSVKVFSPTPEAARGATTEGFGYLIFTPMEIEGGRTVFVDRGFAPSSLADKAMANNSDGTATVTGLIRESDKPNWFTPGADDKKRVFYASDIPSMTAAIKEDKTKMITGEYIEADATPNPGGWPLGRDPRALLAAIPNRHLEYALTWFGLAATLLGVFVVYVARPATV